MEVQRDILIVSTEGIKERFRLKVIQKLLDMGWTTPKGGTVYAHPDHPIIKTKVESIESQFGYCIFLFGCGTGDIVWAHEWSIDAAYERLLIVIKGYEDQYED